MYIISKKIDFNKNINRNVIIRETISKDNIINYINLNHIYSIITNNIDFIDLEKLFVSKHNTSDENKFALIYDNHINSKRIKTNLLMEHEIYIKKSIRNDKINQILNKKILK